MSGFEMPRGIAGLTGRETIPCAVTMGRKEAGRGFPIEKDRFHIAVGRAIEEERGGKKVEMRAPHPDFKVFNDAAPDMRRDIPCVIAHEHADDCISQQHSCYRAPGVPAHPSRAPCCVGNGVIAKRWNGKEYVQLPCPGFECEFKRPVQSNGKEYPAPCKSVSRLVLRFAWHRLPDGHPFKRLPPLPFKFVSGGVNTATYVQGFLEGLQNAASSFGVDFNTIPLFGLPVRLVMHEQKSASEKGGQRFPVGSIVIDGGDPIAWIQMQLGRITDVRRIAQADPIARLSLTGPVMSSSAEMADDVEIISPSIPSRP